MLLAFLSRVTHGEGSVNRCGRRVAPLLAGAHSHANVGETKRSPDEPSRLHTVSGVEAEQSVGASLPPEEKNLAKRHLQKMDAVYGPGAGLSRLLC